MMISAVLIKNRGDWIRTSDLLVPNSIRRYAVEGESRELQTAYSFALGLQVIATLPKYFELFRCGGVGRQCLPRRIRARIHAACSLLQLLYDGRPLPIGSSIMLSPPRFTNDANDSPGLL